MATEPSGVGVYSPKIRDQSLVRKFVSQGGRGYVSVGIFDGAAPVDPDAGTIALKVWFNDVTQPYSDSDDPRGSLVVDVGFADIVRDDVGKFFYNIGPELTANRGVLTVQWTYDVAGSPFTYLDHLQILDQMPLYDTLSDADRLVIDQVSWMFADLFDSTEGGPYLMEPFQTHFGPERIAQLMARAVDVLNFTGFPVGDWGIGPGSASVPTELRGLLVRGTYFEVLRHLIRSYTEIPAFAAMNVTYTDRRDYSMRWSAVLASEYPEYKQMVTMAKRKLLHLGRGSLLVGGGIYGGNARGIFQYGMYASQVRSWRFYPAAPAIMWGATHH